MAETKNTTKAAPETVTVRLPRKGANDDNFELVGLNGKMWQVPCGRSVDVPKPVYELLMRQQEARDILMDYQENIPNDG